MSQPPNHPNPNPIPDRSDHAAFELLSALVALMFAGIRVAALTTASLSAVGARRLAAAIRRHIPGEPVPQASAPAPTTAPAPAPVVQQIPFDPQMLVPHGVHHPPVNGRYYIVTTGSRVGVFLGWPETAHHVVGVSGAVYHSYGSLSDAQAAFIEALYANVVRVVAVAGQPAGGVVLPPPPQ